MPGFLEEVERCFSSRNLYETLGVQRDASDDELKKAYRRLSLKVHPDRVKPEEVAEATEKFQVLSKVYSILSDKEKRAVYDEQGTVDEEDSTLTENKDWTQYWKLLFSLTVEDIKAFEKTYKGSEEELDDLKAAYLEYEGDMDHILEEVMCASIDDEPRFRDLLTKLIEEESLPALPAFVKESKQKRKRRRKRYEDEAKEAEELQKKEGLTGGDENSLKAMIKARQQSRGKEMDSILGALEEKYCKGNASKKKAKKKGS